MKPSVPDYSEKNSPGNPTDFSLVLGGPFFRLLGRAHLSDNALMLVRRRIIVLALLAWLPLLILTVFEGHVLGGVAVPFLLDIEAHIRFLVALPLLIFAELAVHQRMHKVLQQFLERKLIPENAVARFHTAIASATRLRNSMLAEVLLITFVYGVGILIVWRQYVALDTATWYATTSADGAKLSLAGMWYGFVSLPMFQFLLCRWYFRLFIWMRLLWQVSRIPLHLIPSHPDRVGGLGFLSMAANALIMLAMAHGALVAGNLANQIFFLGTTLPEYSGEVAVIVIFVQCVVFAPLLMFAPQLVVAKWKGILEYGALYAGQVRELDTRWLRGGAPVKDPLVGISEIQTLADIDGGFQVVQSMRMAPFTWRAMLLLAIATLAPIAPLLLTMMPLEELLNNLFSILF
ncbi:MAG: hypothetical protein AMJ55_06085 [Gammaproteobacteria bacterium SG8_15]|nr:MAG: hypothetical protein AMJ55_06085 [Gammaproteobacteria bacterium SG8_15]